MLSYKDRVLWAIDDLGPDYAYGAMIIDTCKARWGGRTLSIGRLYATLEAFDRDGLVTSRAGPGTIKRLGYKTLLFTLTDSGRVALVNSMLANAARIHRFSVAHQAEMARAQ